MENTNRLSRYTSQLDGGFPLLRFEPALEAEFRAHHLAASRMRILACMMALLALTVLLIALRAPGEALAADAARPTGDDWLRQLRVWLMRPLTLVLMATAIVPAWFHRAWLVTTPPILFVCGAIGSFSAAGAVAGGNVQAFVSMIAGFLGLYLLLGLLFWQVVTVGALISTAYALSLMHHGAGLDLVQTQSLMMLAITGLAIVFNYGAEHSARTAFLQNRILLDIGNHDGLTRLKNRRAFDRAIQQLWRQGMRDSRPIGLLMIDIDHFKRYNDRYGHQAGDKVLKKVGGVLASIGNRPFDTAARIGGEEFAVLLYGCSIEHLQTTATRIVEGIRGLDIAHAASPTGSVVTASVGGVLVQPRMDRSTDGLLQFGDESLYLAKNGGRDRAVVQSDGFEDVVTGAFRLDAVPRTTGG